MIAIFVYSCIIFIKWLRSSSVDVNQFCFHENKNCNFAAMVGLTNDERCLVRSVRVETHCGSGKKYENVFK